MRWLLLPALLVLDSPSRCGTRPEPPPAPSQVVQLLADSPEKETTQRTEARADVEFQSAEQGHEAFIVARGETPVLSASGRELRLYGDQALTTGFSVDNVILLEVLDPGGRVLGRAAVGFTEGLSIGSERVDLLGRQAFSFEPGEVNVTSLVPEAQPFRLRATVLDNQGVGRVTDVWLSLKPRVAASDDLRGQ